MSAPAGTPRALTSGIEGAEDDAAAGAKAIRSHRISYRDIVVGIAASGTTPFVWGALAEAKRRRATTVLLCFNPFLRVPRHLRPSILLASTLGPEVLTGSTRLKAGTETKLLLNLFTTLAMVRLVKVRMRYGEPAWLVTRYAEAKLVLADPRFSRAMAVGRDAPRVFPMLPVPGLLNMDPPEHSRLRKLVAKAFTQRRVETLRPRVRELAEDLADELELRLEICHFPPGTSKWNKIEHRLFSCITKNWRGRPLTSYRVIVNLIAHTTTKAGLLVRAALDKSHYETGIEVSDEELARVNIVPAKFHGEWNYSIRPNT